MLNEREIELQCKENNFGCNYFGDTAIITTSVDQWLIETVSVYNKHSNLCVDKVMLKHKNSRGNKSGKAHYHKQRHVNNIKQAFETIVSHQQNHRDFNKAFIIKQTLTTLR